MIERPFRVQLPFAVFALPLITGIVTAQEQGPWVVALVVYFLAGGIAAVNLWPVAYRVRFTEIVGRFLLIAAGALVAALLCALITTGNIDGLFAAKPR